MCRQTCSHTQTHRHTHISPLFPLIASAAVHVYAGACTDIYVHFFAFAAIFNGFCSKCVYVGIRVCLCVYLHIYIHIQLYMYVHTHARTHTHRNTYAHEYIFGSNTYMHIFVHVDYPHLLNITLQCVAACVVACVAACCSAPLFITSIPGYADIQTFFMESFFWPKKQQNKANIQMVHANDGMVCVNTIFCLCMSVYVCVVGGTGWGHIFSICIFVCT